MAKDYGKYLAGLVLCGGSGIVASGIALPSGQIVFLRTLLGALVLVALLLATRRGFACRRCPRDLARLAVSGVALGASWLFLFEAYRLVGVGTASLLYYCGPVIVAALSPWLFRERLTKAKVAGFAVVLIGVLLVNGQGEGGGSSVAGFACGGASAVLYAVMVVSAKKVERVEGLERAALQLVFAFAAVAAFTAAGGGIAIDVATIDWAPVLVLGLVNTGLGCFLYFSSIGGLPAQSVSVCGYLEPLSAVVLSAALLGEALAPAQALGVALVIGGAVFAECGGRLHLPRVRRARGAEAVL